MSREQDAATSERTQQFLALLFADQRRLFQFLYTLLGDAHAVEDALQETSLLLWQKFDQYDPSRPFFPWAARFAFLQAKKHQRQSRRAALLSDEVMECIVSDEIEDGGWIADQMAALEYCLEQLRPNEREQIRDRYELESAPADIASKTGRTVAAVYQSMQRIRGKLLECIERRLRSQYSQGGSQ